MMELFRRRSLTALLVVSAAEVEGALRNSGVHWGRIWSKAVGGRDSAATPGRRDIVEIVIRPM